MRRPTFPFGLYRLPAIFVGLSVWVGSLHAVEPSPDASPSRSANPPSWQRVAQEVDQLLQEEFPLGTRPLASASDYAFIRRVTLDLVGHLPTPAEMDAFVHDTRPEKRLELVNRLLQDDRYGENWGRYWRDVIFYRRAEDRALLAADAASDFLEAELNANTPWDEIATAFVTAEGDIREQGATAIIAAQTGRPEETVAELSRIFMGIQIQCAQCHDHPFDQWEREQFHELAAFYPRVGLRPVRQSEGGRSFEVVASDRNRPRARKNLNRYRPRSEHYMSDLDDPSAEGTLMTPTFFVTGDSVQLGASDAERRAALAQWITATENEWFAKALVNRMWSELMGVGFYEPVDDMGPERDASAARTLDHLAAAFTEMGYDVKWLMRTILSTEAYARVGQSRSLTDEARNFLSTNPQPMRSDQLFNALTYTLFVSEDQLNRAVRRMNTSRGRGRRGPRSLFTAVFGYDPSNLRSEVAGSVPQALLLSNSPMVDRLISAERPAGLGGMLRDYPDDRELITQLYLRSYSRPPSKGELGKAIRHLKASENRGSGFEDILWAIINSAEFKYRT